MALSLGVVREEHAAVLAWDEPVAREVAGLGEERLRRGKVRAGVRRRQVPDLRVRLAALGRRLRVEQVQDMLRLARVQEQDRVLV